MTTTRDRLLLAAGELFYDQGITATGVDAVVQAAGVTKPTLYAQFGSKSGLVAAVLRRRHGERRAELEAILEPVPAESRPLAVFTWLQEYYGTRGGRGCAFLNAAAELTADDAAARAVVRAEKAWLLALLVDCCAGAGCRDAAALGSQLLLLVDGVAGRAVVDGPAAARAAAGEARRAAAVLLAAAR